MARTYRRSFYQGDASKHFEAKRDVVMKGYAYPACYTKHGGEKRFADGKQVSLDPRATRRFGDVVKFDWADERGSKQEASRNRRLADQAACEAGLEELEEERQADREELYFLYWDDRNLYWPDDWEGFRLDDYEYDILDDDYDYDFDDYDFVSGKY